MTTFAYDEVTRRSIKDKKIVTEKKDAVIFNGKTFAVGDIIGFQYGNTTVMGRIDYINKAANIIHVEVKVNRDLVGIYGFFISEIKEVYGTC